MGKDLKVIANIDIGGTLTEFHEFWQYVAKKSQGRPTFRFT